MNDWKVMEFVETNKEYLFPNTVYSEADLERELSAAPENFDLMLNSIPLRRPSTLQIISIFPGSLGVDRFYLGEITKGLLKYITFGGVGVWWIADIISAKNRCRAYNCKKIIAAINDPSVIAQMQNTDDKIKTTVENAKKFAPVAKAVFKGAKDIQKTFDIDD